MSSLKSAAPVLPAADVARAAAFYETRLGFRCLHRDAGYAVMRRDEVEIHLWGATDRSWRDRGGDPPILSGAEDFLAGTASCRVEVRGVEALCAEMTEAGVMHPNGPLTDKPWGMREFAVLDGDGNLIAFFERLG